MQRHRRRDGFGRSQLIAQGQGPVLDALQSFVEIGVVARQVLGEKLFARGAVALCQKSMNGPGAFNGRCGRQGLIKLFS